MPVIGRLDGQVEEVLIKPVGRRGRADEATSADPADAPARPASDEPAATDAAAQDERDHPREQERARRPDAIPVWLL